MYALDQLRIYGLGVAQVQVQANDGIRHHHLCSSRMLFYPALAARLIAWYCR
jgi:hypothetical protein